MTLSNGCHVTATRNVPKSSSSTAKTGNRDSIRPKSLGAEMKQHSLWRAFSFDALHSWNIPSVLYRKFQEMTLSNGCCVTATSNVPKGSSSTAKTGNRDSIKSKSLGAKMKQHSLWRAFSFDALHSWNISSVLYRNFQEMTLSSGCYVTATRNVPKGSSSTVKRGTGIR